MPALLIDEVKLPSGVPVQRLLLVERVHYTFEQWFIRQVQQGLLPEDQPFTVKELRQEYLASCWKEEELWQKWSENVKENS